MTRKAIFLIAVAAVLGFIYVAVFKNFFKSPTIEIISQSRPVRAARGQPQGDVPVDPVSFMLDQKYEITEIRVVAVEDEAKSKYPHALWHLISDSSSRPTKVVVYGQVPKGMKPKIPNTKAEPLAPDVQYRMYITAGSAQGVEDFQTREALAPAGR